MPIKTLIDKVDTFELVRDEIGAILLTEFTQQVQLATAAGRADASLWDVRVFTERASPWSEWLDLPDTETNQTPATPIVNVWFNGATFDMSASNVVERQKATGTYYVDCYAYAPAADEVLGGHRPGDERAALEVHRVVRLVRNILMAGTYTYLGLRGTVWRRWIPSIEIFQPPTEQRAAQMIGAARVSLQVEFSEYSPQYDGPPLELISVAVKRAETGQLYFKASYPHT